MGTPSSKTRKLSEIFYNDIGEKRNGELRKGLIEYRSLLTALSIAMGYLKNKDLEKFDALVGENACQIRAIKIAIISSQNQINFKNLETRISEVQNRIANLLSFRTINLLMISDISLQEVLGKEDLDIILTSCEMFVFQCFLLSLMKEPQSELISPLCVRDKSAPKKLKQLDSEISSKFANTVVRKTRRLLSEASVHFTREMAKYLDDPSLIKMVSNEFTHEYNSWTCIPMFWTYKTLLKAAQRENIPLVICAKFLNKNENSYTIQDQELLFFKPIKDNDEYHYIQTEPTEKDLEDSGFVIQGFVFLNEDHRIFCKRKWKETLDKNSIIDIILAGAADHRQYPDENRKIPFSDPEYERYKAMAQLKGFSIDNPTTFFINHVYSLQIGKLLTLASENLELSVNS